MAQPIEPVYIEPFKYQNCVLLLRDIHRQYRVNMFEILFLKGGGNYTTFYVLNRWQPGTLREIMMSRNLGHYLHLIKYGFAQPNQSFVINQNYIYTIGTYEVQLHYPHEEIKLTDDSRPDFNRQLEGYKQSQIILLPSAQLSLFA